MGLLEKIGLIEKIPEAVDYDTNDTSCDEYGEEPVGVWVLGKATEPHPEYDEQDTIDTLIQDIYAQNDLHDKTHSIFKVEALTDSLPKEMVTETKRVSVLSILNSFGLTAEEVMTDGENRVKVLDSVKTQLNADNEKILADKRDEIEKHKEAIAALEAEINTKINDTKHSNEVIETEIKRVTDLIEFMGGTK